MLSDVSKPSTYSPTYGAILLHVGSAVAMAYAYLSLLALPVHAAIVEQKGGHFQYLTIQGLALAFIAMSLSVCADLIPAVSLFKQAKRIMLMTALPLGVVVSGIYWTLFLVAPEFLFGESAGKDAESSSAPEIPQHVRISLPLDIGLHAVPVVTLLLDFFLLEHKYTKNQTVFGGLFIAVVCGLWYSWFVELCGHHNGIFPYPFLTYSPFPTRAAIYAVVTASSYLSFLVLNSLRRS